MDKLDELVGDLCVQVNTPDFALRTPLHMAIESNDVNLTQLLLDFKADPTYVLRVLELGFLYDLMRLSIN